MDLKKLEEHVLETLTETATLFTNQNAHLDMPIAEIRRIAKRLTQELALDMVGAREAEVMLADGNLKKTNKNNAWREHRDSRLEHFNTEKVAIGRYNPHTKNEGTNRELRGSINE